MQDCNENQQNASQGFGEAAPTNLQEEKKPMAIIKCLLVGGAASGKSSILLSYVDKVFSETYLSTIGVDFKVNTVKYQNQLYKLQIWDTAGQQRFKSITTSYYKGALCFFLIYDTTNYNQFLNLSSHLKEICQYGGQNRYVCLVGTKCDLITQKKVSTEMGMQFAHENKLDFMQVTAIPSQNNHQLDDLFMRGVKWYVQNNK